MATITAVAYNTGGAIPGTTQIGNLAIGTTPQDYGLVGGDYGVVFYSTPDQSVGYVIAHDDTTGAHNGEPSNVPAYVGFWRSDDLTEGSFIALAEYISVTINNPQTFASGNDANTWLNNNGMWSSWGVSFTITSSRVSSTSSFGATFGTVNTNGFQLLNNNNNSLYPAYYFTITDSDADILSVFANAGMTTNYQGYIFNVTWGPGSTESTLAKVSYSNGNKQMNMIAVDPTDTNWQNNNNISGTALVGTFNFPATFTPYYPITDKNDWC